MSAYPADLAPAMGDTSPIIGPNLAGNSALCGAVAKEVFGFFYPYLLQQQRLWPTWDRIDDAWRVKGKRDDLDISSTDRKYASTNPDGRGNGVVDRHDGRSKVYPADFHQQVRNKTDTHMSVSWSDDKLPVRAKKPTTQYEHPLYNPTQQAVDSINELLRQCANAVKMKQRDRLVRGSWAKYGHCWVMTDFKYRLIDQPDTRPLPNDPYGALNIIQMTAPQFGGQQPQMGMMNGQPAATWYRRTVDPDSMVTDFVPIRHDAVFIDQTLNADDMDAQPCPIVRSHITRFQLWGNDYDPTMNPFGWLNVQQALADNTAQWVLSEQDEGSFRTELAKKAGLTDSGLIRPVNTLKQRWTAFPMLAIDPATGALDDGNGIQCAACGGSGQVTQQMSAMSGDPQQYSTLPGATGSPVYGAAPSVTSTRTQCPTCKGVGKQFIKPERYVVEMFGRMMGAHNDPSSRTGLTVLRIQRNPTVKDKVPLLFGAHLTEDTAGAIPLAVSEAAMKAVDQLATAYNQYNNAKNQIIDRNVYVQEDDAAALNPDLTRTGQTIKVGNVTNSVRLAETPAFDASRSCLDAMQMFKGDIQDIGGFPPTLLAHISPGRRAATEIQTVSDAAKLPLTIEIDSCNTQIHGRWAQMHIDNIEAYADRDWIQRKTGRTTFGRPHLFCNTAEDYYSSQAAIQFGQYILQASVNDPTINRAPLWRAVLRAAKFPDADQIANDGGQALAQQQGFDIIAQILIDGIPVPPQPDDPHEIYIPMFQQALRSKDWQERAPQNLPILMQRLQLQVMYQQEQMLQQLHEQQFQQQQLAPQDEGGLPNKGQRPPNGRQVPRTPTQGRQQQAGASAPQ